MLEPCTGVRSGRCRALRAGAASPPLRMIQITLPAGLCTACNQRKLQLQPMSVLNEFHQQLEQPESAWMTSCIADECSCTGAQANIPFKSVEACQKTSSPQVASSSHAHQHSRERPQPSKCKVAPDGCLFDCSGPEEAE